LSPGLLSQIVISKICGASTISENKLNAEYIKANIKLKQ